MIRLSVFPMILVLCCIGAASTQGAKGDEPDSQRQLATAPSRNLLAEDQWQRIDESIDRGLAYLIAKQDADGSFQTLDSGQPGVTSLCVMCFLANGYLPGDGKYGAELSKAVEFICSMQTESGVISNLHPGGPKIHRQFEHRISKAVAYNHVISSLLLSEIYGMGGGPDAVIDPSIIQRSLDVSLKMHRWPKDREVDRGGWRYPLKTPIAGSDLSLTGWQIMFLRSARNAGFDVPSKTIDEATEYVLRCYRPDYGTFNYYIRGKDDRRSRGMAGAGILALAHAGKHHRKEAVTTGDWILKIGFDNYNDKKKFEQTRWFNDCYHYGVFYCSQAMYQLGGKHWELFFPKTSDVLIQNQGRDGSWDICYSSGHMYGKCYSSALSILALSAPNQLLPVFQR